MMSRWEWSTLVVVVLVILDVATGGHGADKVGDLISAGLIALYAVLR